ncbi:hypothetical protein IKD57_02805 [Candidatus Saccharibacteria bacterium]|nr:hypothetical protein [Candidatus Saccharibacteria bacterium]
MPKIRSDGVLKYLLQLGFLALSFILFAIIFPVKISFPGAHATTNPGDEPTLALSLTDVTTDAFLKATTTGNFVASTSKFTVSTTNNTGYTLSIHAKTNDTSYSKLLNGDNALESIESPLAEDIFSADTGEEYNGHWGYKPSKFYSSDNAYFLPAPTFSGDILDVTHTASINNTYSITLGARITHDTEPGIYANSFVVTATANPADYIVSYSKDTEDAVANLPADQTGNTFGSSILISSQFPSRDGYNFLGWCDISSKLSSMEGECAGKMYQPGDTYTIDQYSLNTLSLYAMWQKVEESPSVDPTAPETPASSRASRHALRKATPQT